MAKKTIEELVEERKKDAEKRGIFSKAESIACSYGKLKDGVNEGRAFEKYLFENEDFIISSYSLWPDIIKDGGYNRSVWISYLRDEKRTPIVFEQKNSEVKIYTPDVPGWLEKLEALYNELCIEPEKEKARKSKEAEEADLRRRFGL